MNHENLTAIRSLVDKAKRIVIVQADNPDGDSMGSALALEQILHLSDKEPHLYCAVDVPSYLRYMNGWDRIEPSLPNDYDLSIIVDTSTPSLLDKAREKGDMKKLATKPCIVLDHHSSVEEEISFATTVINDSTVSSTGELIYLLGERLGWTIDALAGEHLMTAILGDTQGLSNDLAKPSTYRVMASLVESGVNRPALEEKRRLYNKMPESIFRYKAELIKRTRLFHENKLSLVTIPQNEINEHSPLYNPAPLIQADMLQVESVAIAIVIKSYDDGKITGAIRCNNGYKIAAQLASFFGGGGHPYAAGFKTSDYDSVDRIVPEIVKKTGELLNDEEATNQ